MKLFGLILDTFCHIYKGFSCIQVGIYRLRIYPAPESRTYMIPKARSRTRIPKTRLPAGEMTNNCSGYFPAAAKKKSAGPALISYIYEYLYVYISIYMYIQMTQGPIPKDRTPNPEPYKSRYSCLSQQSSASARFILPHCIASAIQSDLNLLQCFILFIQSYLLIEHHSQLF